MENAPAGEARRSEHFPPGRSHLQLHLSSLLHLYLSPYILVPLYGDRSRPYQRMGQVPERGRHKPQNQLAEPKARPARPLEYQKPHMDKPDLQLVFCPKGSSSRRERLSGERLPLIELVDPQRTKTTWEDCVKDDLLGRPNSFQLVFLTGHGATWIYTKDNIRRDRGGISRPSLNCI